MANEKREQIPEELWKIWDFYLREVVMPALHLNSWKIDLSPLYSADVDCWAEIDISQDQHRAVVSIGKMMENASAEDQRDTLFHELFHAVTSDIKDTSRALEPAVSKQAYKVHREHVSMAEEKLVDTLTSIVAKYHPLPKTINLSPNSSVGRVLA